MEYSNFFAPQEFCKGFLVKKQIKSLVELSQDFYEQFLLIQNVVLQTLLET